MRSKSAIVTMLFLAATVLQGSALSAAPEDRVLDRFRRKQRRVASAGTQGRNVTPSTTRAPAQASNFRVLGHLNLPGRTPHADVALFDHGGAVGKHAYVGTWGFPCSGTGVKIINVEDPNAPTLAATTPRRADVSHEDIVVREIGGRDILAVGIQQCGNDGNTGLRLFDVTDPDAPTHLAFFPTTSGVHELDVIERADGQVLALLALPFDEFPNTYFGAENAGEVRIVDISDPENPTELSAWGLIADSQLEIFAGNDEVSSSFQGTGYYAAHYAHSIRGADNGRTAYVSYWDGGVIELDISDPTDPSLVARTGYDENDDGDAHSLTPYDVGGTRYILQNDEDFNPLAPTILTSTATGSARYSGIELDWAPATLSRGPGVLTGNVHNAGRGCRARSYEGARGKIAIANTFDPFYVGIIDGWKTPCGIGKQVLLAARAGAKAFVSNLVSPDDAYIIAPRRKAYRRAIAKEAKGMEVVMFSDIDEAVDEIRAGLDAGNVKVTLRAGIPSWGYLRVFDTSSSSDTNGDGTPEYEQVGRFVDLPHVYGERRTPPGSWTIHNTEVNNERAYSSWYSHGIVALDLGDPTAPKLAGQFVPAPSTRFPQVFGDTATAEVWGVAIDYDNGNIYASDMRSGLWIVKPTGDAAP